MRNTLTALLGLSCLIGLSQNSISLISYDFISKQFDTVLGVSYDSTLTSDFSPSNNLGLTTIILPRQPVNPLVTNSNYSERFPAKEQFNVNHFPFSACVAMRTVIKDTMQNHCSGSMVGKNLVLTAAHCVTYLINNNLSDEIYVFPSFDDGKYNGLFDSVQVIKAFYNQSKDIAVLQLADDIGLKTGWLGYGYDADSILQSIIMHKMSYPAFDFTGQKVFNGDSLFYENGYVDASNHRFLSVNGVVGISGQSGSAWFIQDSDDIAYGVASVSNGFRHARITPEYFYSFKNLETYLSHQTAKLASIEIFPNPTSRLINVAGAKGHFEINIYDMKGTVIQALNFKGFETATINCESIKNGLYILKGMDENGPFQTKLVINH